MWRHIVIKNLQNVLNWYLDSKNIGERLYPDSLCYLLPLTLDMYTKLHTHTQTHGYKCR